MAGFLGFSPARFGAMVSKEFTQMRRDRLTFAMMVGIPLLQLILFGFAINSDPKQLPTAILDNDRSVFSRDMAAAMKNSDYFKFTKEIASEAEADELLRLGRIQFVLTIPQNFGRDLVRGVRPVALLEADATDPAATSNAVAAIRQAATDAFNRDLTGPLLSLRAKDGPVDLRLHARYNPEAVTQYNIVPGLMGVVLTMTLVIITSLAITRERERGTMENLLITPVRPTEVLLGKILPYIVVGYVQMMLIVLAAKLLFAVPFVGSLPLLFLVSFPFIAANLGVGITFSTIAQNQLQAVQMSFFFFLPSILLSGFMFPFQGMPQWAQWLGSALPLTHYLRVVRGIVLKGNTFVDIVPHMWPIGLFLLVSVGIGVKRYRQTLD
ncbi:MAG: ABC-type multidrug transport system, permease component [Solidesulfovibrio magneticus str. Maddingley MBC34]|uniref:ABC-type multidrug transport system, permease component n=1 Tax=Solidesulfovibrio magneticus str. Maddingley MBC34 TaxID=1206767 RepID=K6GU33_9BACT|nr:MAG: ABC-type multidrug transport system, permease component [Solidesulfovibrio magneticus str. Maddingley MBC34]